MRPPLKPPALRAGDRVAVVAPAGPCREPALVDEGVRRLRRWGLVPILGRNAKKAHGYLAGDDAARAGDLQAAFDDRAIRGVFCIRGGYGVTRILDLLDLAPLARDPKPIVGYSDVTALLMAVRKAVGLVGFHGPMVATQSTHAFDARTEELQRKLLFEPRAFGPLPVHPSDATSHVLVSGAAEGPLWGGNLSLLGALCGTRHLPTAEGALAFFEDVDEAPYRVDRLFTQLRASSVLDGVAGFLCGDFARCETPPGTEATDLAWVLKDRVGGLGKPAAHGFPFGHRARSWTLPIGVRARLDATDPACPARLVVLEAAVDPRT